jgi:hypothetical protein
VNPFSLIHSKDFAGKPNYVTKLHKNE